VREYNFERPHQSLGMAVPWDRFRLAGNVQHLEVEASSPADVEVLAGAATRRVGSTGLISFTGARYHAAVWLAGEDVAVICDGRLVHCTTAACSSPPTPAATDPTSRPQPCGADNAPRGGHHR
jgi:hypothetical protein